MSSPDRPFQRPIPPWGDAENDPESPTDASIATHAKPTILDPDFHQSVWKPWNAPQPAVENDDEQGGGSDVTPQENSPRISRHRRRTGWTALVAGLVVLTVALALPLLEGWAFDAASPLVVNMPELPSLSWSAKGGEPCAENFTKDHMILSDTHTQRVWSLDLRSGKERWSVSPSVPFQSVVCLSGANAVAVTDNVPSGEVYTTTVFDGSTGNTLAVLPSSATVQVLPLGRHIGLMSPENTLSMVTRNRLDTAVWTHEFSSVPPPSTVFSMPVDDSTVQLVRWGTGGADSEANFDTTVLSLRDGTSPAWFTDPGAAQSYYIVVDDIVISMDWRSFPEVTALDASGRELWTRGDAILDDGEYQYPLVSGDHLYFQIRSDRDESVQLLEVDPLTGDPVSDSAYEKESGNVWPTTGDYLAVSGPEDVTLLDEDLQPLASVAGGEVSLLSEGTDQLFLGIDVDSREMTEEIQVKALSAQDFMVLWTLNLEPRQSIQQMGRHLIVRDRLKNTLHGLSSESR